MDRVVFCPSSEVMAEAEKLATEWSLPIVVGRSGAMEDLEFDETLVQILEIPVEQSFQLSSTAIKAGRFLLVTYNDDWMDCRETWVEVATPVNRFTVAHTTRSTKHQAIFRFRLVDCGITTIELHDESGIIADAEVKVVEPHA